MVIENQITSKDDDIQINQIFSDFLNYTCEKVYGKLCQGGKSTESDTHYTIDVKNDRSSIKLSENEEYTHDVECIVHEVRNLCNRKNHIIENYKIKKIKGFPMNGDMWRKGEVLLIEWGKKYDKINLNELKSELLNEEDKEIFMKQMAINSAFACYLNIDDRSARNFVWYEKEKKIFSIDHEKLIHSDNDESITEDISLVIQKFYGNNWYKIKKYKKWFMEEFENMWKVLELNKNGIEEIFKKHNQSFTQLDKNRIEYGIDVPYTQIMR